jgi:hypothetical protein
MKFVCRLFRDRGEVAGLDGRGRSGLVEERPGIVLPERRGMIVASYTRNGKAFLASKPRHWADMKDLGSFDLAPDGKRFAVKAVAEGTAVGHFHAELL